MSSWPAGKWELERCAEMTLHILVLEEAVEKGQASGPLRASLPDRPALTVQGGVSCPSLGGPQGPLGSRRHYSLEAIGVSLPGCLPTGLCAGVRVRGWLGRRELG